MSCISLRLFRRDEDNGEMKEVPTEENMAYSCLSNNLNPLDINSTTEVPVKENLSYVSHSVGQTISESPAQNNGYEAVDITTYKQ